MSDALPRNQRRAVRLAGDALAAAMSDNWPLAMRTTQRISDECGGDGVMRALLCWCDTVIARTPGLQSGAPVRLTFMEVDSGRVDENADEVPATVRWAGRLLAARLAQDEDTWWALIEPLPEEGPEVGRHAGALLRMATINLKHQVGGAG